MSLFSDVGPLEAIAENKKEQSRQQSAASVAKSSLTAAKLGAFAHSAERIVDELGLLYPENRGNLRENMASVAYSWFNIEDGARGFKHTSNPHLGFATASLESGSANIDDSPLQEALLGMPMSRFSTGTVNLNTTSRF